MKTTHTPGPWYVIPDASFDIRKIGRSPAYDPLPIATVNPVSAYSSPESNAEFMANARLIAAAPDLLAALKEALPLLGRYAMRSPVLEPSVDRILPAMQAAIARATA